MVDWGLVTEIALEKIAEIGYLDAAFGSARDLNIRNRSDAQELMRKRRRALVGSNVLQGALAGGYLHGSNRALGAALGAGAGALAGLGMSSLRDSSDRKYLEKKESNDR